jgi:hypothetical protein
MPLVGLVSLIWFLIRVIPKPSRAAYPCQRVAAPLASGFVVWLLAIIGSAAAFRRGRTLLVRSRHAWALVLFAVAAAAAVFAFMALPEGVALADPPIPNEPIGEAKGVNPGRVVWMHDPWSTDWAGPGDGHWWESEHTDQAAVDRMMRVVIRELTGEVDEASAWDALFRHFNLTHGNGDVGYSPGQKIAIKVNLVSFGPGNAASPITYDIESLFDYMNTSPQVMLALLRQLVHRAGVDPADIAIGDPVCIFANQFHDPLYGEFPDVVYFDSYGYFGRTLVTPSTVDFHWSSHPPGVLQDKVLTHFAEADYLINLATFKSHIYAGVTLCAKNYYGWLRLPTEPGHYNLHASLPNFAPATSSYRCLVDLMGHAHSGGKALLYLIDGLYSGTVAEPAPYRWAFPPFNNDWTSSLFASQDPVAIDSVAFDFMQEEGRELYPQMAGADDYLIEAALADDPPSGTFYDPNHDGDVERLPSLGVHEHWSNSTDMLYSRNLDPATGTGIELVIAHELLADGFESGDTTAWSSTVP